MSSLGDVGVLRLLNPEEMGVHCVGGIGGNCES